MEEREIGPAFDLATERRKREIEALPFEERMMVERVMFSAQREKDRADAERARMAPQQAQAFRQQILSGSLAPHLQPAWARNRRPSGSELDMRVAHAMEQQNRAVQKHDHARIDERAAKKVDAVLALSRGKSESPDQRLKAMEQALAAQSRRLGRLGREHGRER